jgi:MoaA/NifB/PqqE/SkfB family radical SAM enzyme
MKRINKSAYKYGFKNKQDEIFPPMVFAEITNICNLKCIHCPYSYIFKQKFYKPRHMEFNIYKKIVNEVSKYKDIILRLVCDGEPLMHPNFLEMIKYAKQNGIKTVSFNTNGTLLNE